MIRVAIVVLLLAVASAGCSVSNDPSGQCAGSAENGKFQKACNTTTASKTEELKFEMTGVKATGNAFANVGGGSMKLEIFDAEGKSVWTSTFSNQGQESRTFTTSPGAPGQWKLVVTLTSFTGQYAIDGKTA